MSEKDKANPAQRVMMEERWRAARAACAAGTCDPSRKHFHTSTCARRDIEQVRTQKPESSPEPRIPALLDEDIVLAEHPELVPIVSWPDGEAADVPPHIKNSYEETDVDLNERTNDRIRKDDGPQFIPPGLVKFDVEGSGAEGDVPAPYTEPSGIKYGGWTVPSHAELWQDMPELAIPEIKGQRGGMRWALTRLEHEIVPTKAHWWSRTWYEVWTRVSGSATPAIFMGEFRTRAAAKEQCAGLDKINVEINRRRDQIEDAGAAR